MIREDFKILLQDLYKIYNPKGIKDIDFLLEKYNGREFDAIKYFYIRYNHHYNSNYDQDAGTDHHIRYLINKYSEKERVLSQEALDIEKKEKDKLKSDDENRQKEEEGLAEEERKNKLKKEGKAISQEIEEAVSKYFESKSAEINDKLDKLFKQQSTQVKDFFKTRQKQIESQLAAMPEMVKNIAQSQSGETQVIQTAPVLFGLPDIEVKLVGLNFGEADLDMPNKEFMDKVSVGDRLVLKDSQGGITGLEVKDITYDFVSYDDKCVKEIALEQLGSK